MKTELKKEIAELKAQLANFRKQFYLTCTRRNCHAESTKPNTAAPDAHAH